MQNKIKKVIILGSGALKIGEAGEFDYSGSQAIKALKDEGIATILVNPNIATIQTSDYLADQIYFLPVTAAFVARVIEKERPDGILLGFGGQTALQCGIDLDESGVLSRFNVKVLGTQIKTIKETEDRDLFVRRLSEIGIKVPVSAAVTDVKQAVRFAKEIGFPVMLRVGYALGGLGSGVCKDVSEVERHAAKALSHSPQLLIEEYLSGWKEIEYEVVRDSADNCITVCNMENLDPMGIHTGESIVVAPSQTLDNMEYHKLRQIAIQAVRHLGIIGECNIQYALNPKSDDYRVIEVNARLSRSSALASKATGYPLAYVAAKLGIGHALTDIVNSVTGVTKACFEPALDYVVVKAPRWDFQKFQKVSRKIGSGMKSVGEVMAIGRTFEEALQKALRMLKTGACGLVGNDRLKFNDLESELKNPSHERIFAIVEALKSGFSIEQIHDLSLIDKWFLYKIQNIVELANGIAAINNANCPFEILQRAKQLGFSDYQIEKLSGIAETEVRRQRHEWGLYPYVKQIDTLAAEYPAATNYLFLTYNSQEHDIDFGEKNQVIILGSGAYSIGSSVEFDWCCVNTAVTLRKLGYRTIIINYNPETVSTDYSESDKLYFEDLNLETVLEITRLENPLGVITSMGGQIPNNLALKLHKSGVKIIGTSALSIDNAEDRKKFSRLLDELDIMQPEWTEAESSEAAECFARQVGYPVLVRPSYVLSGAAMGVASNSAELARVLRSAAEVSEKYPVVVSKFIEKAKELDIDAVAREGEIVAWAVSEHVENAGVHSGDATLVHPPQRTYLETIRRIKKVTHKIAEALKINGPFNIQFIAKQNQLSVIECNLRASRSLPFVSKIQKINFIDRATRVIMGHDVTFSDNSFFDLEYVGVKAPQFSFMRLDDADPALGVEMASTGEVACLGDDFEEAFLKAMLAVGYRFPIKSMFLSTGPVYAKAAFIDHIKKLISEGIKLYATKGTADFLYTHGIDTFVLKWPLEKESPNAIEYLSNGEIDMVINIPKNYHEDELTNDYLIRRHAVDHGIPLITNIQLAQRFVESIFNKTSQDLSTKSWDEYKMNQHAYREGS
jgi:carbamoyl-phosphate synthase large subunit